MKHIILRDLAISVRSGGGFGQALVFFLIITILVPLGVGPQTELLAAVSPGILWVAALLACLVSLERIFATDWEDGSLEILATAPVPLETVFLAKAISHWCTTGLPLCLCSPVFALLLNMPTQGLLFLVITLTLGTPALSLIGSFGAALTVGIKRGGLLLSLLVLPLNVPILIFGAEATRRAIAGQAASTPTLMLFAITLGCFAILPFAGAKVIKVSLR